MIKWNISSLNSLVLLHSRQTWNRERLNDYFLYFQGQLNINNIYESLFSSVHRTKDEDGFVMSASRLLLCQVDDLGLVDGRVAEPSLKRPLIDHHGIFHVVSLAITHWIMTITDFANHDWNSDTNNRLTKVRMVREFRIHFKQQYIE